jgi:hypothetical protein
MREVTNCLLTGIPIKGKISEGYVSNQSFYWYLLDIQGNNVGVSLCEKLYSELLWPESEISVFLRQNRSILIGEFAKDGFKSLHRKYFHFDCSIDKKDNHFRLKEFIESIIAKGEYPTSRREKYDRLLKSLYSLQDADGSENYNS